ncbi:MAG TPA: type IV toxin-antitoxin system AbiEi family antitoxin domain-containing protein [Saprospiraceae bacterium]|nr:type IV toxin-antitoxin system AbiEi family antitoxin domain-containing protein [Saprospiraceae bacterium]HMQ85611.1 type IV toxin-antitoxin system AbiEi family antitoxin domain-containing protein [Saprospiraceae bacterium]
MNNSLIKNIFQENHGVLTTKELKDLGVSHYEIRQLLEKNIIDKVKRGVYVLSDSSEEEYLLVTKLVSTGIFCLQSAAFLHNYTTSIPLRHHLAIYTKDRYHLPEYPPIKLFYWQKSQYELGVQEMMHNDVKIKIYDREKTVCDFLKFRNKLELSMVKEVLHSYLRDPKRNIVRLKNYSRELKVSSILDHYLEVLV